MTFIGKLFVLVNLILSLVLGGLAFALFVTGIDWSDNKGKAGKPDGETLVWREQLRKDMGALGHKSLLSGGDKPQSAAAAGETAHLALGEAETRRSAARPTYTAARNHLLDGATDKAPAQEVDRGAFLPGSGVVPLKNTEPPLISRSGYLGAIDKKRGQAIDLTKQLKGRYEEDITQMDKLVGNTDYDKAKPREAKLVGSDKGLIALIASDRLKREGLEEVMRTVESQDINTQIDARAVNESYGTVEERIRELEAYLKKRGVDFTPWAVKAGKKEVEKKKD